MRVYVWSLSGEMSISIVLSSYRAFADTLRADKTRFLWCAVPWLQTN